MMINLYSTQVENLHLNIVKKKKVEKTSETEVELINFVNKGLSKKANHEIKLNLAEEDEDKNKFGIKLKNSFNKKTFLGKSMISDFPSDHFNKENFSIMDGERRNSIYPIIMTKNKERKIKPIVFQDLMSSTTQINIQMILIDHLRWGQYTFYCICLLSSISERYLNTDYSEKICKSLLVFTRDEEAISRSRYPIVLCVLAAEFLYKLGKLNSKYQYKCQSIAEMMLKLGECLQSSIKDEDMLNYYLREQTDHKKRSALEIIAENRFYDLLKDENVATIVGKLWYGTGKDLSIFKFCRISRILTANIRNEHYRDVISSETKDKVFSFQYCEYTKNCSVRYLVDSVSTIMTTILYQYIIYLYVSISKVGDNPYENSKFKLLNLLANIIVYSINLNLVLYIVYVYMTNRTLKMTIFILLDLVMFFAVLANFMNLPSLYFDNPEDKDKHHFLDAVIYSVIIICAWMRVIGILMTTRSFGPFLRIIYLLLSTFFNFLLIFLGTNTVFAQVFTILFRNTNENFKGFFTSWITLFNASLGIIDFTNFTIMKIFGYILLMAYTTLTNIMLLNLVVAIINNLFQTFEVKADAENRAVLVLTYERIKWDDDYGLLILLPAPFNLISFPFVFILCFIREKFKNSLNVKFSKICYIIVVVGNFLILIIASLFLFPFAYFKSIFHSAYDNAGAFSWANTPKILYQLVTRPLILIYYIVEDIKLFWTLVYKDNLLDNRESKVSPINRDIIMALRKVLFDFRYNHKKKIISQEMLYDRLGMNKRIKKIKGYFNEGMNSSFGGSESDDSSPINSNNLVNRIPNIVISLPETSNLKSENSLQFSHAYTDYTLSPSARNLAFRFLIERLVDKDLFIDIERTLFILPPRAKYTDHFLYSLKFLNMRVLLRGLQKYFFHNAFNNPLYSYKKLQQLIYKILIKFKMIYRYLPETQVNQIKTEVKLVNEDIKYSKEFENLIKMEEKDEFSDYDDMGGFDDLLKYVSTQLTSQKNNTMLHQTIINSHESNQNVKH